VELRLALDLTEPGSASIAAVGGKAVNLHRMLLAELPVPRGFCLTTHAYRTALEQLGAGRLRDLFAGIRAGACSPDDLASIAGEMRQAVGSLEVPEVVKTIVLSSYRRLGRGLDNGADVAVAVRSSATAEDLPDASFAGQQDSFLNVVGEAALLEAVRACWASLWTDRAVVYRASHGIDPAQVALAVVVQRMVDAEAAGVMFTADPVTGSRSHTVVDANHGLGESVVSGEINPDRFVIDTASERIVRRTLGDKHLAVRSLPGGGVTRELLTPADRSDTGSRDAPPPEAVVSDTQLVELTRLGTRAAELFDAPQDTEWALDARGGFWLTQSRPVTTLFPLVHFVTDARSEAVPPTRPGPRLFFCASLAQGLTRPITPLGRGAFRLLTAAGARLTGLEVPDPRLGAPFYAEGGERIFGDVTTPLRNPVGRRLMRLALTYMEARSEVALVQLEEDPDFALLCRGPQVGRRHEPNRVRAVFGAVAGLARFWAATRVPTTALLALCAPDRALRRIDAEIEALRHSLDLPAGADARQRLDAVETLLSSPRGMVMPAIAGYAIPGFLGLGLAGWLLRGRIDEGELQAVLRGLPNNVTTQMNLELWDLSRRPRPADSAPGEHDTTPTDRAAAITTTDPGLEGFLRRWGDRAVAEIDLGMPRWREQPDQLLATLRNYALVTEVSQGPRAVFERGRAEGEAAVQALLDRADNPVRRVLLGLALDRARQLVGLREAPKFGLITVLARAREQFLLIGAE
ncbi:MAG: PEP/pyruvate-binding domain-containing protein, partial [Micrococcales bacterium]|nr:PEP/pyruvate-binding domain-containing protein [Micrococcales bacterium]